MDSALALAPRTRLEHPARHVRDKKKRGGAMFDDDDDDDGDQSYMATPCDIYIYKKIYINEGGRRERLSLSVTES